MKQQAIFLFPLIALLASCSKETQTPQTITESMNFTVYFHGQTQGQPDSYDTAVFIGDFVWHSDPLTAEDSVIIPVGLNSLSVIHTMMNEDSAFVSHTQWPEGVSGGASGHYYGDSLIYHTGWGGLGAHYDYRVRGIK